MNRARPAGLKRWRIAEFCWDAYSADDRPATRLLVKLPLRQRLARHRSVIVISLLMLALSVAVWGGVYLLNFVVLR